MRFRQAMRVGSTDRWISGYLVRTRSKAIAASARAN
jgi:hypothetical protein